VLRAAVATAPVLGAEVEVVHVPEPGRPELRVAAELAHLRVHRPEGDVVDRLAEAAQGPDVALVVVGARERRIGPRTTGHVVGRLLERLDVPLLVVPPEATVRAGIRRVLVAMKGTRSNAKHLTRAIELAAGAPIELVVCHVDDERTIPSFSDQAAYDAEAYAQEFLDRYVPGGRGARLELRIGDPTEQVLRTAEDLDVDLIAVGARGGSEAPSEVARAVVERSHVPVLLVPVLPTGTPTVPARRSDRPPPGSSRTPARSSGSRRPRGDVPAGDGTPKPR
jgi:nucleotide-binding universal stress UspA family protein